MLITIQVDEQGFYQRKSKRQPSYASVFTLLISSSIISTVIIMHDVVNGWFVVTLVVLFLLSVIHDASCQMFVVRPRDRTVLEGDTVVFYCTVTGLQQMQNVYWFRVTTNRFLTVNHMIHDVPQRNRLSVIGDINRGEFNLQLRDVRLSDEGEYRCGFAVPGMNLVNFRSGRLFVHRPPNPGFPLCEVEPMNLDVNDVAKLTCRSEGGIPPAFLTWRTNERGLTNAKTSPNVLSVIVSGEHNGLDFICEATSAALPEPRSCQVRLLNIRPDVRVEPPQLNAVVGQRAVFICVAFGLPEIVRYEWRFDNEPVEGIDRIEISSDQRTLIINDVRLFDDNTPVQCTATTTNGLSGTSGGLLRVYEQLTTVIITTTMNPTTPTATTTIIIPTVVDEGGRRPISVIVIIVVAVIVGQLLIVLIVYISHKHANMKRERRSQHGAPAMAKPGDMGENIYVRAGVTVNNPPPRPDIDPETGTPIFPVIVNPAFTNSHDMGEAIYNAQPLTPPIVQNDSAGVYDEPPDSPPPAATDLPKPVYTNTADLQQAVSPTPISILPLRSPASPTDSYEEPYPYTEVPYVDEPEAAPPRLPPPSNVPPRPPVVITSPPPNKVPPRPPVAVDKRRSQPLVPSPSTNPYYGLKADRQPSQYLSLRHYDEVEVERALLEGEQLDEEARRPLDKNENRSGVNHDDDGYVYELPATEVEELNYDIPPSNEKREYTFMGSSPQQ